MLILSRKCGESLLIGGDIEIKITEIAGDKVKIGIEAPRSCRVVRKELFKTVEQNREAAAAAMPREMRDFLSGKGG